MTALRPGPALFLCALAFASLASADVPSWPVTWSMQSSTICQPCNMSGFLEPAEFYAQFGIVDVDCKFAFSTNPPDPCSQ
jgi:hypothetical protein